MTKPDEDKTKGRVLGRTRGGGLVYDDRPAPVAKPRDRLVGQATELYGRMKSLQRQQEKVADELSELVQNFTEGEVRMYVHGTDELDELQRAKEEKAERKRDRQPGRTIVITKERVQIVPPKPQRIAVYDDDPDPEEETGPESPMLVDPRGAPEDRAESLERVRNTLGMRGGRGTTVLSHALGAEAVKARRASARGKRRRNDS